MGYSVRTDLWRATFWMWWVRFRVIGMWWVRLSVRVRVTLMDMVELSTPTPATRWDGTKLAADFDRGPAAVELYSHAKDIARPNEPES